MVRNGYNRLIEGDIVVVVVVVVWGGEGEQSQRDKRGWCEHV